MIIHVTSVSGFILMLGKSLKYHRPEGQQLFYPRGVHATWTVTVPVSGVNEGNITEQNRSL